jgi:hypothetical protein
MASSTQARSSSPSEHFAYDDFISIFQDAVEDQMKHGGGPVEATRQAKALRWVKAMKRSGADFNELGPTMWLAEASGDLESELTPLAWAVDQGLPLVASALLTLGADPDFSFQVINDNGTAIHLDMDDLISGWSSTSYHSDTCASLIHSASERNKVDAATPRTPPAKKSPKAKAL